MDYKQALKFFEEFYHGEWHIPGEIKLRGYACWAVNHPGSLSTFDGNELTRLVLMAHRDAYRVMISQGGPGAVKISISKRSHEGIKYYERHPTLKEALKAFGEDQ